MNLVENREEIPGLPRGDVREPQLLPCGLNGAPRPCAPRPCALRPAAPAAAVSLDQKLQGTGREEKGENSEVKTLSHLKGLKTKSKDLPHLCFFWLVKGMHPPHIVKATLGSRIDIQGFLFAKRSRSEDFVKIHTWVRIFIKAFEHCRKHLGLIPRLIPYCPFKTELVDGSIPTTQRVSFKTH